MLTDN